MEDETTPRWGVELIKQVAILSEKVPSHIEWVERNIKDHETRIRTLEAAENRTSWLPRAAWGIGSGALGIVGTILVTLIIDHL